MARPAANKPGPPPSAAWWLVPVLVYTLLALVLLTAFWVWFGV